MSVVEIADLSCSSAMFVGCAEGELEVSQRDRILGVIGAGKAFGELAVLYNCQRTASVRGQSTSPASSLSLSLSLSLCLSVSLRRRALLPYGGLELPTCKLGLFCCTEAILANYPSRRHL